MGHKHQALSWVPRQGVEVHRGKGAVACCSLQLSARNGKGRGGQSHLLAGRNTVIEHSRQHAVSVISLCLCHDHFKWSSRLHLAFDLGLGLNISSQSLGLCLASSTPRPTTNLSLHWGSQRLPFAKLDQHYFCLGQNHCSCPSNNKCPSHGQLNQPTLVCSLITPSSSIGHLHLLDIHIPILPRFPS